MYVFTLDLSLTPALILVCLKRVQSFPPWNSFFQQSCQLQSMTVLLFQFSGYRLEQALTLPFISHLLVNLIANFEKKKSGSNIFSQSPLLMLPSKPSPSLAWIISIASCSVQFSTVAQSCLILCKPMDCSTPGLPVLHYLPELAQTHVHWVGDAIQPFRPLLSPYPPAFNLSQHQGLFQWVGSSHQVAKVLDFNFSISPFIEYSGLISFRLTGLIR